MSIHPVCKALGPDCDDCDDCDAKAPVIASNTTAIGILNFFIIIEFIVGDLLYLQVFDLPLTLASILLMRLHFYFKVFGFEFAGNQMLFGQAYEKISIDGKLFYFFIFIVVQIKTEFVGMLLYIIDIYNA